MNAAPGFSLEQAVRELTARLDRLMTELQATRAACTELGKALKTYRPAGEAPPGGRTRKARPLEPGELESLAQALRSEPAEHLRQRLDGHTVAQLQQLAAHLGSDLARRKPRKDELIALLISEARYADQHRKLRGF